MAYILGTTNLIVFSILFLIMDYEIIISHNKQEYKWQLHGLIWYLFNLYLRKILHKNIPIIHIYKFTKTQLSDEKKNLF